MANETQPSARQCANLLDAVARTPAQERALMRQEQFQARQKELPNYMATHPKIFAARTILQPGYMLSLANFAASEKKLSTNDEVEMWSIGLFFEAVRTAAYAGATYGIATILGQHADQIMNATTKLGQILQ